MTTYQIFIEPTALKMLAEITDRRVRESVQDRIDGLAQDPELQGKPLMGEFKGFRSLRAVGQRYRIIFKVKRDRILVVVVAVGLRRERERADIYALARKLLRLRLVR